MHGERDSSSMRASVLEGAQESTGRSGDAERGVELWACAVRRSLEEEEEDEEEEGWELAELWDITALIPLCARGVGEGDGHTSRRGEEKQPHKIYQTDQTWIIVRFHSITAELGRYVIAYSSQITTLFRV